MKTIYLACADYNYEGFNVIRAFESEADADAFTVPFAAHMEKEPDPPPLSEWDNKALMEAWHAARREWEAAAPPGFERGDSYHVESIELHSQGVETK